MFHYVARTCR